MKRRLFSAACLSAAAILAVCLNPPAPSMRECGADEGKHPGAGVQPPKIGWIFATTPKDLNDSVKKGLAWLASTQHEDGGWAQGEESAAMGGSMNGIRDVSNVGDTCMALLAILRSGAAPGGEGLGLNVAKGIVFVLGRIEESDDASLWVTQVRNTRIQTKIGTYIDTFLAAQALTEVKGRMPAEEANRRVDAALAKVIGKIEKNQKANGTWDDRGWAPVLGQSLAARALNYAVQKGAGVDEEVRKRAESYSRGQMGSDGKFSAEGSAGVGLYAAAGSLSGMQNSSNTNAAKAPEAAKRLEEAKTDAERAAAQDEINRYKQNDKDLEKAKDSVVLAVARPEFVQGFGSNGGEEFLSYMHISESLVVKGGKSWEDWDRAMSENLGRIQNADGSWSGHHCITGRTFCTSAALMVLMSDRTQVPAETKVECPK